MVGLIFIRSFATAYLVILIMQSSILKRPRQFLSKLHPRLSELLSCPMCLSFWVGLCVCFLPERIATFLVIAGLGFFIERAAKKYLPCEECSKPVPQDLGMRIV